VYYLSPCRELPVVSEFAHGEFASAVEVVAIGEDGFGQQIVLLEGKLFSRRFFVVG